VGRPLLVQLQLLPLKLLLHFKLTLKLTLLKLACSVVCVFVIANHFMHGDRELESIIKQR
jgi:hypothetical protein